MKSSLYAFATIVGLQALTAGPALAQMTATVNVDWKRLSLRAAVAVNLFASLNRRNHRRP